MILNLSPVHFGAAVIILGVWILMKAFLKSQAAVSTPQAVSAASVLAVQPRSQNRWRSSLEENSIKLCQDMGHKFSKHSKDLDLLQIPLGRHALAKISSSILWALLVLLGLWGASYLGILGPISWWSFIAVGAGAALGFILPDRQAKEMANKRRDNLRQALSAYLDLVKILLEGGSHTDGALFQAAAIGRGWAFTKLRAAIDWSRINAQPVTVGLNRLAKETGVVEVSELAAIISLSDNEGARLSETLAGKAESLASHDLAEARAKSYALAERMSVPTVVIAISFVVFVAYPALASLSQAA